MSGSPRRPPTGRLGRTRRGPVRGRRDRGSRSAGAGGHAAAPSRGPASARARAPGAWRDQASRALNGPEAEEGTGPVNADELEDDDLDELPLGAEEGPDGGTVLVPGGSPLPTLRVLPHGISRKRLEQAVRELQLPVVMARDVDEADVVMTLRNYYKQKAPALREAEDRACRSTSSRRTRSSRCSRA